MSYRGRSQSGQNYRGRPQYDHNYRIDFRKGNFRGMQSYRGQNFRGGYEVTIETRTLEEVEVGLEKESIHVILEEMIKAVVDQDQV